MSIKPQFVRLQHFHLNPAQYLVAGFIILILIGTLLLMTPWAAAHPAEIGFIDALFMATSAACVTGLSVIDVGLELSTFGQIVLVSLMQIGGLGILTFSTIISVLLGRKVNLRDRMLVKESMNQLSMSGLVKLVKYVVVTALTIEIVGGIVFSFLLYDHFGPKAIYMGFWHAISAFCNAGFDLFGNFEGFTHEAATHPKLWATSILIILGGIGFGVIHELLDYRKTKRLTLHAKMVLVTSAVLLLGGAAMFLVFEHNNAATLGTLPWYEKVTHSFFQSTSARTAGFNSINIAGMTEPATLVMMLLMFIGASPASVGGGIKTTTAMVIFLAVLSIARGSQKVRVYEREVASDLVLKALIIAVVAMSLIAVVTFTLSITEDLPLYDTVFETVSAFATVGLSRGITTGLSPVGRVVITLTMFIGRVGLLTMMLAFLESRHMSLTERPKESVIIG